MAPNTKRRAAPAAWAAITTLLFLAAAPARGADAAPAASKLAARNLLLIVNKNDPAGGRLAAFYARQRNVPDGRILALDLPAADEVAFDDYERKVVPAVRTFLTDHMLADEVTCLVTFYGVPLRVGPRSNTPAEAAEYRETAAAAGQALERVRQALATAEEVAAQAKPDFRPPGAQPPADLPGLAARVDAAVGTALAGLAADADAARRAERFTRLMTAVESLYGPLEAQQRLAQPAYARLAPRPQTPEQQVDVQSRVAALLRELEPLVRRMASDADARARGRELIAANLGLLRSLQVSMEHKVRLETAETEAAVDSELACVWWPDSRLRHRWQDNPLNYRVRFAPAARPAAGTPPRPAPPRTLMVTRIDAPTEQLAHDLIATSVRVEGAGLKGQVALDARGKPPTEPYGKFDEGLRELDAEVRLRTRLRVTLDNSEPVFRPRSLDDVALYCGWYSLRTYVPGMRFNPGAVGYHVASGELVSLHNPGERGWVRGLMGDGVVGTLGPVAEPYLHAFPPPAEFFPLLMTGELTLAEVYWLTNPLTSWMNTCVGDPLYRPYAKDPALPKEDLSAKLRVVFTGPGGP